MYTRKKKIIILKIINVLLIVQGIGLISTSMAFMTNLVAVYHDNLETVLMARGTPGCIRDIIIGTIFLILAGYSRRQIGDSNFYSGYFEVDLDGYISFKELSQVMGKSEKAVKRQLSFLRITLMKGYKIKTIENEKQVVLDSKTAICECKNCAARIEKRMYFTGKCPYCGSSDLFAKVLTGNRFYSIESQLKKGENKPEFYETKHIMLKKTMMAIYWSLTLLWVVFCILVCLSCITDYNNEEYLVEILFSEEGPHSYELIRRELVEMIIWFSFFLIAIIPVSVNRFRNIKYLNTTYSCSRYFAHCKKAIVPIEWLPTVERKNEKIQGLASVRSSMRRRYLKNCTFEVHDGKLKMALAKKIVKDKCPSCDGAITGAVNENYRCQYCNNLIMDVVVKK